jgi:hypothetical protein
MTAKARNNPYRKDHERLVVHESVITHYSEFFRAAINGKLAEVTDKTVKLGDVGPETFKLFVCWLYYKRLPNRKKGDDSQLVNHSYDEDFSYDWHTVS